MSQSLESEVPQLGGSERGAIDSGVAASSEIIPSLFYDRVLQTLAISPDPLRRLSLASLILHQALQQLDPQKLGMDIIVGQCMSPQGEHQIVRSLREMMGIGTPPWPKDGTDSFFRGAESLEGYAVTTGRLQVVDEEGSVLLPYVRRDYVNSTVTCPILRANRVAGYIMVFSTQVRFFSVQGRQTLVQSYANLLSLCFNDSDFYSLEHFALHIMPPNEIQSSIIGTFRQRVSDILRTGLTNQRRMSISEAEMIAWQQVEEEIIRFSSLLALDD
jgi:hypothetical protein